MTIAFLKPLPYWKPATLYHISELVTDLMSEPNMNHKLILSWIEDVYSNIKLKSEFYKSCQSPAQLTCFKETFAETVHFDFYHRDTSQSNAAFEITASRMYLSMQNFTGSLAERDLLLRLKSIATEHSASLNLTASDIVIYSPVFPFLEQLDELVPSTVSILMLSLESIAFVSFFLLLDVRSVWLLFLMTGSLGICTIGGLSLYSISLNVSSLYHLLLLPGMLSEFMMTMGHVFLLAQGEEKNRRLKIVFDEVAKPTGEYVNIPVLLGFGLMRLCTTYSFNALSTLIMIFGINVWLHVLIFYPAVLMITGTCWWKKN